MVFKNRRCYAASGLLLVLAATGCGSAAEPIVSIVEDTTSSTSTTLDPPVTTVTLLPGDKGGPAVGDGEIDPGLQPFIDTAAVDLAERLGIAVADIVVDSAVLTVWADTSLGCPDPKMMYAQVLTDGAAIALRAGGATYWYHSGGTQGPFLCDSPLRTTVG